MEVIHPRRQCERQGTYDPAKVLDTHKPTSKLQPFRTMAVGVVIEFVSDLALKLPLGGSGALNSP